MIYCKYTEESILGGASDGCRKWRKKYKARFSNTARRQMVLMNEMTHEQQIHNDIYPSRLLDGRVYQEVTQRTIEIAFKSYKIAQCFSIISFVVGIVLLILAAIFAFSHNDKAWMSAAFGAFGTADIIVLLITRPLERIQWGVNDLIKSQIACLNFAASYESIARYLIAASELPFENKDRDLQKEFERAKYLMESALQFVSTQQSIHVKNK
jgi:hypothetical protein